MLQSFIWLQKTWTLAHMVYINDAFMVLFGAWNPWSQWPHCLKQMSSKSFPLCGKNSRIMTIWLNYHCSKTTFICLSASHLFVLTADFAQPYWTGTTEALNATLSAHVLWGWNTNRPQEAAQVSTHSDGIRFHHCWKTAHRLNISSGINKQSIDLCVRRHKKQAYAFRVIHFAPADWLASLLNAHVAQ